MRLLESGWVIRTVPAEKYRLAFYADGRSSTGSWRLEGDVLHVTHRDVEYRLRHVRDTYYVGLDDTKLRLFVPTVPSPPVVTPVPPVVDNCREHCPILRGGICPRHNVYKHAHWVQLCIHSDRYYRVWESGRGPGQIPGKQPFLPPPINGTERPVREEPKEGVGVELVKLLPWLEKPLKKGCRNCQEMLRTMSRRGPEWCREHAGYLCTMVVSEAAKRGHFLPQVNVLGALYMAITLAEMKQEAAPV